MIRGIVDDLGRGVDRAVISRRFHGTLAAMFAESVQQAAHATGVDHVVLSGGCFLNRCLRQDLIERLDRQGLAVATHQKVSPGDAGLSLGQAVIASAIAARGGASIGAN
jgi:hydrogenase maturation protein HypF